MNCKHCNDTGSLSKNLDGYLDCAHCDVAEERAQLEAWVLANARNCADMTAAWLIHQRGKVAAAQPA